jgi:hypothetical protein
MARTRLGDAGLKGVSAEGRFTSAYHAALRHRSLLCKAQLIADGNELVGARKP